MSRPILLAAVAIIAASSTSLAQQANSAKDKLQGSWKVTEWRAADLPGEYVKFTLTFKGDRMTWNFLGIEAPPHESEFKLGEQNGINQIDFDWGQNEKGVYMHRVGIYAIEGNKLRICFTQVFPNDSPKDARRPTDFTTPSGSGWCVMFLERADAKP
jgi:uncharacterized protein (TIGR03067 family)